MFSLSYLTGEAVPADKQFSYQCFPLILLWTVHSVTEDLDCGQTRQSQINALLSLFLFISFYQEMPFTCNQCEYESCEGWTVVRLRSTPVYKGFSFIYDKSELNSRYHCFPCDYTLCSDCARDIEAILRSSWSKSTSNRGNHDDKLIVFCSQH